MKCSICGSEVQGGKRFCGDCGSRLSGSTCPQCGAVNPKGKRFCGDCGATLPRVMASDIDSIQPVSPQKPHRAPAVRNGMPLGWSGLRRIGRAALMVGFTALVMSVILFVLSNALTNNVDRLIREGNWAEAADVANMVVSADLGAWIMLNVAIISIVIGAVGYIAGEGASSSREDP